MKKLKMKFVALFCLLMLCASFAVAQGVGDGPRSAQTRGPRSSASDHRGQLYVYEDQSMSFAVGGEEYTFYSFVPNDFSQVLNMVHLDYTHFVSAFSTEGSMHGQDLRRPKGDKEGMIIEIMPAQQNDPVSYARFSMYAYDPSKPDGIGQLLYGVNTPTYTSGRTKNGRTPGTDYEALFYKVPDPYIDQTDDLFIFPEVSSGDIKSFLLTAPIPISPRCTKEVGRHEASAFFNSSGGRHYSLPYGLTWGLRARVLHTPKGIAEIDENPEWTHDLDCNLYASNLQPVIFKLVLRNIKVKAIRLPFAGIGIVPGALFDTRPTSRFKKNTLNIIRWDYATTFDSLFRQDGQATIVSHRGYWRKTGVAQNSLAALQEAEDKDDSDMIELDVRSTKDSVPICFHDDLPQKVLLGIKTQYPTQSVYDLTWDQLEDSYLYDRHNNRTDEKLASLEQVFKYYVENNLTKPINLDIGIPAAVKQGAKSVPGQPFFDAVFLKAVRLAVKYKITSKLVFKGKYRVDDPIWLRVKNILIGVGPNHARIIPGGKSAVLLSNLGAADNQRGSLLNRFNFEFDPRIAYTPKFGEDIGVGTSDPRAYRDKYLKDWLDFNKVADISGVELVGMEVRLKNDDNTEVNRLMQDAIAEVKQVPLSNRNNLKVGIFSETPSTCQGYWTKSAVEKYIDFSSDKRNNFDWLLNKGYDYIITDFPNVLKRNRYIRKHLLQLD